MSVFLFPNPIKDRDLAVTRRAAAFLLAHGVRPITLHEYRRTLALPGALYLPQEEALSAADQVLTVGGDGTLLRASPGCIAHAKPVLGVNLGRTGFLATCEVDELEGKLGRLAAGDYTVERRGLLEARAVGHGWQSIAVNDVMLFGMSRLHPMDYTLYCDGVCVSNYRSDGLIVATPTGSTAYSLSAGGPILDAMAAGMVVTPVCAHSIHATPMVFAAHRRLSILAAGDNRDSVTLCTDSQSQYTLAPGERVEISAAGQTLALVVFDPAEQFRAIETKLMRR